MIKILERFYDFLLFGLLNLSVFDNKQQRKGWREIRHAGLFKKEFRDDTLVNNIKTDIKKTLKTLVFKETCDYYIFAFIHFVGE